MKIDFDKQGGLVPAIIQDARTRQVLMLGYMNKEALDQTLAQGTVTFYSRSKKRLWTKGETSGNFLRVKNILPDCDQDCLLIEVEPVGPTCHRGTTACFHNDSSAAFLYQLEQVIAQRINSKATASYTHTLYQKGINKIAQKVGEEAVELIIEAKDENAALFKNEAADLLYHFLILLKAKHCSLKDIESVLQKRYQHTR